MSIQDKAMLVNFSLSRYTAKKHDRRISAEVAANHNTALEAGRYNKRLLASDKDSTLGRIAQLDTVIRDYHYQNTSPWLHDGTRALSAALYWDYTQQIADYKNQRQPLVDQFIAEYPQLVRDAQVYLNGLFNAADYPSVEKIRGKFGFSVSFSPIPASEDWRIELTESAENEIRAEIETAAKQGEAVIMGDLWQRLYDRVNLIAVRLRDPEQRFRDSMIESALELADLLPKLNVSDDANLNALADEVRSMIGNVNPYDLRPTGNNKAWKADRANVQAQAQQLSDTLAGYC